MAGNGQKPNKNFSTTRQVIERGGVEQTVEQQMKYFEALFRSSADAIICLDKDHKVVNINPRFEELFGYSLEELRGKDIDPFISSDNEYIQARSLTDLVLNGETVSIETVRKKKDGSPVYVSLRGSPIFLDGRLTGVIGVYTDITVQKEAERKRKEAHRQLLDIIDFLPDATFVIDRERKVLAWNRAIEEMTGVKKEDIIGRGDYAYALPLYGLRRPILIDLIQMENKEIEKKYDYIFKKGDVLFSEVYVPGAYRGRGAYLWSTASPLYDHQGNLAGAIESIRDVTDRKKVEEKLKFLSIHDALTGLYNRAYFEEEMRRIDPGRHAPITIITGDVDGLKLINDTLGHDKGDEILKAAARVIQKPFRSSDCVARIGGDEFAILLPKTERSAGENGCKRIREEIARYNEKGPVIPLNISIGMATGEDSSVSLSELFKKADSNMYREKLLSSASTRSSIVNALMFALEARDFITEGHAERLQSLVTLLGKPLGLSKSALGDLKLLAQFHDIGKVGVPDRILFKPGPLTAEESSEMQRHCEIGHRIALSAPDLAPIAGWILKHHEWWNGQGYPLGIAGEEIPVECRILAIADAYDAMTSDRPYRKALSWKEATAELARCSGTQFDPHLARCFIQEIEKLHPAADQTTCF